MKLAFALIALLACQAYAAPSSDHLILKTLQTKKSANVIVSVKGNNVAELRRQFSTQKFSTRGEKLTSFHDLMKSHADETQANILSLLNNLKSVKPIQVSQLWVSNQIAVKNADLSVVQQLLAMDEVTAVRQERIIPMMKPKDIIVHPDGFVPMAGEQWGVSKIQAPEAWAKGSNGKGAVVGLTDTGARATHEALAEGLRADFGWFDPYDGTKTPNDQDGHGTHTAGTVAGRKNGVGVAPGAQWIACRGCESDGCTEVALIECGQWMACPTDAKGNKDCSKAPNAVSNSWGGGQGDDFYDDVIAAWVLNDIAPLFAIGNEGDYGCGSASSPGDSIEAIGVGSTTVDDDLSYFSSTGPTYRGRRIKPEISAPGSAVVSSYYLSDTSYSTMSGTSMATPHAAGLTGLLYGANPKLTVAQVRTALIVGAQSTVPTGYACGGIPEDVYPNHMVGHGRINAVGSLSVV